MIVLHTNVISEVFRPTPNPGVLAWPGSFTDEVAITTITLAELRAGIRRLPAGARARWSWRSGPRSSHTGVQVHFSYSMMGAAEEYAEVLLAREQAGVPISTPDAQIAAICRAKGAICATRSEKDFAETDVQVLNPWRRRCRDHE